MLTKEVQNGLIGIALRAEMDDYSDGVMEMIVLTLRSKPKETTAKYMHFWLTYRPWTRTLCLKIKEYLRKEQEAQNNQMNYRFNRQYYTALNFFN